MIQAKINGQIVDLAEKTTIQQFLQAQNHKTDRVAVELNGQIVPKSAYGQQEIKAEDTLTGRPLKMGIDMLVLLVGMRSNDDNTSLETTSGLRCQPSGFMQPKDSFIGNVESNVEGIFYAGAVTAPKNIGESINEGTTAALAAARWIAKSN